MARHHRSVGGGLGVRLVLFDGLLGHGVDAGKGHAGEQGDEEHGDDGLGDPLLEGRELHAAGRPDGLLAVGVGLGDDVHVDQGREQVADDDGIAEVVHLAQDPEQGPQHADEAAVDRLAQAAHRGGGVVRSHEEGAHDHAAGAELGRQERGVEAPAAEEAHDDREAAQHGEADLPVDDVEAPQHQAADEQRHDGAADDAGGGAQEHAGHVQARRDALAHGVGEDGQGRRRADAVQRRELGHHLAEAQ